jgi:hypothetical protein
MEATFKHPQQLEDQERSDETDLGGEGKVSVLDEISARDQSHNLPLVVDHRQSHFTLLETPPTAR